MHITIGRRTAFADCKSPTASVPYPVASGRLLKVRDNYDCARSEDTFRCFDLSHDCPAQDKQATRKGHDDVHITPGRRKPFAVSSFPTTTPTQGHQFQGHQFTQRSRRGRYPFSVGGRLSLFRAFPRPSSPCRNSVTHYKRYVAGARLHVAEQSLHSCTLCEIQSGQDAVYHSYKACVCVGNHRTPKRRKDVCGVPHSFRNFALRDGSGRPSTLPLIVTTHPGLSTQIVLLCMTVHIERVWRYGSRVACFGTESVRFGLYAGCRWPPG